MGAGPTWPALFSDRAPFQTVGESLEVKEVWADERRYIVCYNAEQARRDAARRQAVLDRLETRLERSGVKGLVTRSGFARFRGHVVVCFLAFLIRSALERRLFEDSELDATFAEVLDALHQVQEVRVEVKGIPLQLVTESPPLAQDVFKALGMRPPLRLQKLA